MLHVRGSVLVALVLFLQGAAWAQEGPPEEPVVQVRLVAEQGFVDVLYNGYQEGVDGTLLRLNDEGGQDTFLPFQRVSAEAVFSGRHQVILLYQPIDVRTQAVLRNDLRVAGVSFPAGTPVDLRYGFDFYRISYMYDLLPGAGRELAVGVSLQIRNASYSYTSADGLIRWRGANQGPVGTFKLRGRLPLGGPFWSALEADGFYLGGNFGAGGTYFVGSVFDVSLRGGARLMDWVDAYANVRYLGGQARGFGSTEPVTYARNALDTVTVTVGLILQLPGA